MTRFIFCARMRKRLTKIFGEQLSGAEHAVLPGDLPLNVVLKSGDTLFGKLLRQTREQIEIADNRFQRHMLSVDEIDVIVYDYPSTF